VGGEIPTLFYRKVFLVHPHSPLPGSWAGALGPRCFCRAANLIVFIGSYNACVPVLPPSPKSAGLHISVTISSPITDVVGSRLPDFLERGVLPGIKAANGVEVRRREGRRLNLCRWPNGSSTAAASVRTFCFPLMVSPHIDVR
jgi:hypothetical protein